MADLELLKNLRAAGVKAVDFHYDGQAKTTSIIAVEFFPGAENVAGLQDCAPAAIDQVLALDRINQQAQYRNDQQRRINQATIPPLRPEVPAVFTRPEASVLQDVTVFSPGSHPWSTSFQATVAEHEIGIAYCKGFTYQYAYPKGATPADACRWSHIDETEVREELWDIKPGDIVYDIGSAFGSYALTALAMGAAQVMCFNPNPQEQDLLLASAGLNGWHDNIARINVGLWSESGYLNDEEQTFTKASGDFKVTKTADGRHTQLFAVQSLDSIGLAAFPVDAGGGGRSVAKLDVEGAEVEVLKGARVFFAQHQPAFVLIEKHVFKDPTLDARTDEAMADLGYVLVTNRPYHSVVHALYRMKGWDD